MKGFFNKIGEKLTEQKDKIKHKVISLKEQIFEKTDHSSNQSTDENTEGSKKEKIQEEITRAPITKKLTEEETNKIKNLISIEEDESTYTYNINQNEEEEDYEYEIEEENPKEVDDKLEKNNITKKIIDSLSIFKSESSTTSPSDVNDISLIIEPKSYHICNRVLQRGSMINIQDLLFKIKCQKQRIKKNLLNILGYKTEEKFFVDYLIEFDYNFLYFIKDTLPVFLFNSEENKDIRLIGKRYNLLKLYKIQLKDYDTSVMIRLIFKYHSINKEFSDEDYEEKDIYLTVDNANSFFKSLEYILKKYNIPLNIPKL